MENQRRWPVAALLAACLVFGPASVPAMAASQAIYYGNGTCRDIALTYDVEFSGSTQSLIDTIDSLGIRTTWFFLGDSVDAYPGIVRQVAQHHFIGNHTLNHLQMPTLSREEMRRQLLQSEANIERVSGLNPSPFWRPPYGEFNSTVLEVAGEAGYDYTVMWSIDTVDWSGPSAETIRQRIVQGAEPGAISLQHGTPFNSIEGTRLAVGDLRAMGYQFVTIPEILGIGRTERDFGGDTYVIQPGDSFAFIGRCHNVSGSRVQAYNELADIPPGITVNIPHTNEIIIRLGGVRQSFAVYPRLVNQRSMVHVRLAEALGAAVSWNGTSAIIAGNGKEIAITPGQRVAMVNGAPVDMGEPAFLENSRILAPVRFLTDQLGRTVSFDGATYTVGIQ